eukprot:scaffold15683_cov71-Skeletonema_dohrnii-CCMP3373.AAC.3
MLRSSQEQRRQRLAAALDTTGDEFAAQFPEAAPAVQGPMAVEENNNNAGKEEHNDDDGAAAPMDVDNDDAREEVERDPIPQVAAVAPPAAAAVPLINLNLEAIHQKFKDPRKILLSSRGDSTFCNHQRENTKLIFYLYENNHQFLYDEFYRELRRVDSIINYDHITHSRTPLFTNSRVLVFHSDLIGKPNNSIETATVLKKILREFVDAIPIDTEQITLHSWRKCAHNSHILIERACRLMGR